MSDFIARLVQRQFGQIKTAEPRLPEPYAPVSRSEAQRSVEVSTRQSTLSAAFESLPARSGRASLVDETLPQDSISEELIGQTTSRRPEVATTLRRSETTRDNPPHHAELELRSETRSPIREQTNRRDVSAIRFISNDTQRDASVTRTRRLLPAAATDRLSAPPRLAVPQDGIVPPRARYEQPAAEPPVHVTIGRIEITALTQPTRVKRAPAAHRPSMSLEDYLARRQRRES